MARQKICSHCRQSKPLGDYHNNRNEPDGHATRCKECVNNRSRGGVGKKPIPFRHGLNGRARRALAEPVPPGIEKALHEIQEGKCIYCGRAGKLTLDHVIPIDASNSPGSALSNLVLACVGCNSAKGAQPVEEWLGQRISLAEFVVAHRAIKAALREVLLPLEEKVA